MVVERRNHEEFNNYKDQLNIQNNEESRSTM